MSGWVGGATLNNSGTSGGALLVRLLVAFYFAASATDNGSCSFFGLGNLCPFSKTGSMHCLLQEAVPSSWTKLYNIPPHSPTLLLHQGSYHMQ